jgi:hypothetical protein
MRYVLGFAVAVCLSLGATSVSAKGQILFYKMSPPTTQCAALDNDSSDQQRIVTYRNR